MIAFYSYILSKYNVKYYCLKKIPTWSDQEIEFFFIFFSKLGYTNFECFYFFCRLHTETCVYTNFLVLLEVHLNFDKWVSELLNKIHASIYNIIKKWYVFFFFLLLDANKRKNVYLDMITNWARSMGKGDPDFIQYTAADILIAVSPPLLFLLLIYSISESLLQTIRLKLNKILIIKEDVVWLNWILFIPQNFTKLALAKVEFSTGSEVTNYAFIFKKNK